MGSSLPEGAAVNDALNDAQAPTASDIAFQFVRSYYQTETDKLHAFYNQNSILSRIDPALTPEENAAVVGRENIAKKLQSGTKNVRVAIDHIDAQETAGGGVMIVLTGILTSAGTNVRAFTQTFLLGQETIMGQTSYSVFNDALIILSKSILSSADVPKTPTATPQNSTSTQTPKAATAETATSTSTSTATQAEEKTEETKEEASVETETVEEPTAAPDAATSVEATTETDTTATEAPATDDAVATRKDKKARTRKAKKVKEEKSAEVTETKTETPPVEPATEPEKPVEVPVDDEKLAMPANSSPPVTNSWAGRLFFKSAAPLPLQPPIPDPEDAKGKGKSKNPKVKGPKVSTKGAKDEPAKVNGKPDKKEHGTDTRSIDECSIYVANLNKPIKKEEVRKLFESYGTIEDVHPVYAKNFKNFAFVRFESPASVEKVLKAASQTPFVLGDVTLAISRKKTIPRDRPTSSTRGAFRGGRDAGRGGRGGSTFKGNGTREPKAAENNDGFTEATRRGNRKRPPQNA